MACLSLMLAAVIPYVGYGVGLSFMLAAMIRTPLFLAKECAQYWLTA